MKQAKNFKKVGKKKKKKKKKKQKKKNAKREGKEEQKHMYCKNKRHVNAMQVGDADADRNGMMQARDTYVDRDEA
jgi:hypothetical protein